MQNMNTCGEDTPLLPPGVRSYGLFFGRSDLSLAVSTSVVEGLPDEHLTSPVRRTFLLIVLFDLILSFILWIIYVQQRVEAMPTALYKEVCDYRFSTSLFDTVVLALLRFIFLELVYGVLKVRVPWWSAGTTSVTSLIVIVKCFLYDFHAIKSNNSGLSYTVLIAALILSWIEISFLVYRVIPQERAANHVANCLKLTDTDDINSFMNSQLNRHRNWYSSAYSNRSTTALDFHTAEGSINEQELPNKSMRESAVDIASLLERVNLLKKEMWDLYTIADFNESLNSVVHNLPLSVYPAKIYQMRTTLFAAPHVVFRDLTMNVEQTPLWNPNVASVECIQTMASENIDIIHNVTNKSLQGLISPRDFVLLRTWGADNGKYFVVSTSVEHPKYPPFEVFTRAHQFINACVIESHPDDANKCYLIWFLSNDLKVNIPQMLLEKALHKALSSMMSSLIERSKRLTDDVDAIDFIPPPICHLSPKYTQPSQRSRHKNTSAKTKCKTSLGALVESNSMHSIVDESVDSYQGDIDEEEVDDDGDMVYRNNRCR